MTMNKKAIDILFFFISFFLIFNNIPKVIQMNFLGGPVGNKLVFYPLFIGFVYTIYCQYKDKNVFINFDKFIKFILLYLAITFISLIFGLYNYPYYDLVINGPVTQIEKLPKVMAFLDGFGINIDQKVLIAFWMIARAIKGLLFEVIYTFGGAYMIYCWYHDNWKTAFNIMVKAVLVSLVFVFSYSVIEIFYLAGNQNAKEMLEFITPYIHIVKWNGTWYPPLLWNGQLRSIFSEPSFFGIYFAFATPILLYNLFKTKESLYKNANYIMLTLSLFCLFLTQARTAVALLIVEVFFLTLITVYIKKKDFFYNLVRIFLCIFIAFSCSIFYINNMLEKNVYRTSDMNSYLESNLVSLWEINERSNNARYSMWIADFKIGLDNLILGVGKSLRDAYIPDYLSEDSKNNNSEIKRWIKSREKWGILKAGFARLNEYTVRFAEMGILGLGLFLLPAFVLIRKMVSIIRYRSDLEKNLPYMFVTLALIGILVSGFSMSLNVFYCYWVLLGLGYAMCFGKDDEEKF